MTKRKTVKKIAVQKHDEASFVIEQVLDAQNDDLVLSLPKGSKFAESVSNFSLLKKQADLLEKNLKVESVDEDALAMADKAGIEASNPFFGRMEGRQFSDIIVNNAGKKSEEKMIARSGKAKIHSVQVRDIDDGMGDEGEKEFIEELASEMEEKGAEVGKTEAAHIFHHHRNEANDLIPENVEEEHRVRHFRKKRGGFFAKNKLAVAIIAIVVVALLYLGLAVLPKANIALETKKEVWSFSDSIIASKNIPSINIDKALIPAEVFSQKVNRNFQFQATGKEFIERKAVGTIVIYNAFNSESQALVATTRFETPDGKVFRIASDTVVPGATINSGKITPASVEVDIVADEAGEKYNIGPVAKLTIPGFSGTDRFDGFYGEIPGATSGGFIGESVVATLKEREAAVREARKAIENSATTMLSAKIPEGFTTLKEAGGFDIVKERVDDKADSNGMFSVFIEAEVFHLAFREADVESLMEEIGIKELSDIYELASHKLAFNRIIPDFENGTLELQLNYEGLFRQKIDLAGLKAKIVGKKQEALESLIAQLPGLSRANVSLWPFWVSRVPKDLDKVSITID